MAMNLLGDNLMEYFKREVTVYLAVPVLLFLFSSSFTVSILTVKHLQWEDHVNKTIGAVLFVMGLIFFTSLYQFLNCLVLKTSWGKNVMKKYKLNKASVLDISNKQVSAVQAFFCCITGFTSTCYSCTRDMLKTSHYISEAYAWFGAAYFLYDIWSMYDVYSEDNSKISNKILETKISLYNKITTYLSKNAVIVFHHLFIGGFGFLVITHLRGGMGDCFFGFVYLMEFSTPFVSLRGILSRLGLKDSKIYVFNGLLMLGTFFVFRVILFPVVMYLYAQSVNLGYFSAIYSLPRGCKISILILVLPQFYWFIIMLQGATKVLKPKKSINGNYKNSSYETLTNETKSN